MRLIDSHVHVWDPDALAYPWLEDFTPLRSSRMPAEHAEAWRAAGQELAGWLHVQADARPDLALAEVDWVASLPTEAPLLGIVAYAPLERGAAVADHLADLRERPLVVGVRRATQNDAPGAVSAPSYLEGMIEAVDAGLTIDLCVRAAQLPETVRAVDALLSHRPDARLVLDHAGKPAIATGERDTWRRHVADLARMPAIACKLSGLVTEADWTAWTADQVAPYAIDVLELFGPDRVMVGSDWPVVDLAGTVARWWEALDPILAQLSPEGREAVLAGTAERAYVLSSATDRQR